MGHNPIAPISVNVCPVKKTKEFRNALLFTVLAGPAVLMAQPASAQQYVPPPNEAVSPAVVVLGEVLTEPAPAPPPKPGVLSRTGAETMPLVRDGLALLALGAGLVLVARRRREQFAAV